MFCRYKKSKAVVKCARWFQNGDHPKDCYERDGREGKIVRRFRRPDVPGVDTCRVCGHMMHVHGWIDLSRSGFVVHPGDWIVEDGSAFTPFRPDEFDALFERLPWPHCKACGSSNVSVEQNTSPELDDILESAE